MTMPPTALYRSLLREAKRMNDYNFRMHAIRKVKADFKIKRDLQGEQAVMALQEGEAQLGVLRRQAVLGQMYPSARSVMD